MLKKKAKEPAKPKIDRAAIAEEAAQTLDNGRPTELNDTQVFIFTQGQLDHVKSCLERMK